MRLTRQTNYAIRIMMYCAANQGSLSQIPEIANAYHLSEAFLFKILRPITQHGFVESVRGRKGGIRLARPASSIKLSEVVKITEDSFAMADCFEANGTDCPLVDQCGLSSALNEALDAFFAVLAKYTIDDLANAKPSIHELLGLHLLEEPTSSQTQ